MCSRREQQNVDPCLDGKLMPAVLVEQEEDEEEEGTDDSSSSNGSSNSAGEAAGVPTFDVPYFRYIDEEEDGETEDEHEGEEEECSSSSYSRSLSSPEDDFGDSSVSRRYGSAWGAATPYRALGHLLNHLRLEADGSHTGSRDSDTILYDFLLTYLVYMSTSDLCQSLLGHYCSKRSTACEDMTDILLRKRKILLIVSQWNTLYRDFLRDNEYITLFLKSLYRFVLDDLYDYPSLEKELKDFQRLLSIQHRHTVDKSSPYRKSKGVHKQISAQENWLHPGTMPREEREVLYRLYVSEDSYISVKAQSSVRAQHLLSLVADRLDCLQEDMVLAALTYAGEKALLPPQDSVFSDCLSSVERLQVYRKDLTPVMSPLTDDAQQQQGTTHLLGLNAWDVAITLTSFDWSLFECVHEPELICFTCSRDAYVGHTGALERLLQRCNEVQLWVMTQVLLCSSLCTRVQLLKKFIKIAAHCKAQRNMNSFFAIIMGLNTAAISRLSQTWEKVPGKFRKLFSELETLTDPSLNHKAYRTTFKKMKTPKLPFLPLLLKDITFIHEGNKTFLDNLLNFDKLHMIAESARLIKHCQLDPMGDMLRPKDNPDMTCVKYLHVISSQETLFDLSHRLEPRP
ncbi:rap guanine nucleotide exchange factor 5-like [Clupea harengus]|uniref:Rap guanine nucleotide exchange factor 5-like n=1 Tax=Clupea harengus TaxID=7950 RepID=A0A6P8G111_CLUHA|nr:rap guanine nucleotide exchange factor 5-like [Clupea harengus]